MLEGITIYLISIIAKHFPGPAEKVADMDVVVCEDIYITAINYGVIRSEYSWLNTKPD
jgi:hypothetical protein